MSRKQINKEARTRADKYFKGRPAEEISTRKIAYFMDGLNKWLQKIAHTLVKKRSSTTVDHMDRRAIKDSIRLYTLKHIAQRYRVATIEYLWGILKDTEWKREK